MIQKQTCQYNTLTDWLYALEQLGNMYTVYKDRMSIKKARKHMKRYDGINPDTSLQVYANIGAAIMGGEIITEDTLIDIWTVCIYE